MSHRRIITILLVAIFAIGSTPIMSLDVLAQSKPPTTKASPEKSKKPGEECEKLASNTQAHKDCIARQAKSQKPAKPAKKP